MSIEKNLNAIHERIDSPEWKDWTGFDLYELTARCFYYLSGYSPDTTLGEALEIIRQVATEQKTERKKNNGRNEL